MSRDELIALVRRLDLTGTPETEEELHEVMDALEDALPHSKILNLLYHTRPELTAEEAIDEALRREAEWREANAT